MARATEAAMQTLRMKYKAAYEAYQSCVRVLSAAAVKGDKPSADLLGSESTALKQLTEARAALLAAMARG